MNGLPLLTTITALPAIGAVLALLTKKHARAVALLTALLSLALALVIWTKLPADGSIGLV